MFYMRKEAAIIASALAMYSADSLAKRRPIKPLCKCQIYMLQHFAKQGVKVRLK
jgi:hypothetical protein